MKWIINNVIKKQINFTNSRRNENQAENLMKCYNQYRHFVTCNNCISGGTSFT